MISTRRIWALPALALTLMLGACSTPDNLSTPHLEPQFGTAENETGTNVAFISTGRIYSLSKESGHNYQEGQDYGKVLLRRFDGSGNLAWTQELSTLRCNEYYDDCQAITPRALEANSQGYTFALYSDGYDGVGDCGYLVSNYVSKVDATGRVVSRIALPHNGKGNDGSSVPGYSEAIGMAVDGSGNIYAAQQKADFTEDYCGATRSNIVAKYSTTGALLWQRTSTVGVSYSITVSSTGSVYVVGDKGMARYSNSGNLNWTKPGNFEEVTISGSNIYTRYRTSIFKYDGNGTQLWKRTQSGLTSPVIADMKSDGNGNVYLAGKYNVSSTNRNAFIRKLNSSGSVLWTKTYGTSAYDDARGITTINGSEIYTTGSTQGSLAHTNIGGRDGYLRKANSSGNLIWSR